jgi:multidrug efflux system membrane fusion protein
MALDAPTTGSSVASTTTAPAKPAPRKPPPETAPPRKHSGPGIAVWLVLALVIIGGVVAFLIYKHQQKPPPKAPPPVTISTTNAVKGEIEEAVWRLGTVTPIYTAMVSPRVDGQLIRVNYTEGQMVTTNDLLAEIDPGPYQAMLTESEGQLARDKALLRGAGIDLDRYTAAYAKNVGTNVLHAVPKQTVDDQQALVDQDRGTVKFDEGQVANAKVQLAYCFIHAPIAGRTGLRLVDPGNVVHAANTNALVVIAQLQPITVIFSPAEDDLPAIQKQLHAGHKMAVEAWNRDKTEKLATGTFLTMDTMIDATTGTVRIKALFDNADLMLFPNQFVNIKLIVDTLQNVTLIPTAAIQRNPTGAFVYVVTNETVNVTNKEVVVATNETVVAMRTITPGVTDADISSVAGVNPGEVIATDNFNKLGDGMQIIARPPGGERQKGGAPGGKKKGAPKDKAQDDPS